MHLTRTTFSIAVKMSRIAKKSLIFPHQKVKCVEFVTLYVVELIKTGRILMKNYNLIHS